MDNEPKSPKVYMVEVSKLKPYEKNAKIHDKKNVDNIANSIKRFGFRQHIVIDRDNVIIIGHGRYLAAKKLKMEYVPCEMIEDLTEEEIKEYRIADNKTNESGWDVEILADDIQGLKFDGFDFDFSLTIPDELDSEEQDPKEDRPCAVRIVFKNADEWRKYEAEVREFVEQMEDVKVSVGEAE